ncbi:MAG: hypothetical protein IKY23_10280 [Lachnospiraceae bacterium]|nr:hypothetical protein [Lachnospiraceae bacterium]
MFDYNKMGSIFDTEFIPCGDLTLDYLEEVIVQNFRNEGVPIATKRDGIKAGLLSKDPCLVIYNPQNLDYHTIVLVIRNLNKTRVISMYSAGTASAQHIGGGMLNMEYQSNKLKGAFKSAKQKSAEESEYNTWAFRCVYDALEACGVMAD